MLEPTYLKIARLNIGERESLGPNDSPFIRKLLAAVNGLWLKGQPWCGSAMAYWMQCAGAAYPKDFYRALAWATWGEDAHGPKLGAVAVLTRVGGGHVAMVTAISPSQTHVCLLGANQGDMVRESWFPVERVTAFRKPIGANLVAPQVLALGTLSTTEA
jgi:uncharacterized protein (TIGR02594 family)